MYHCATSYSVVCNWTRVSRKRREQKPSYETVNGEVHGVRACVRARARVCVCVFVCVCVCVCVCVWVGGWVGVGVGVYTDSLRRHSILFQISLCCCCSLNNNT